MAAAVPAGMRRSMAGLALYQKWMILASIEGTATLVAAIVQAFCVLPISGLYKSGREMREAAQSILRRLSASPQ